MSKVQYATDENLTNLVEQTEKAIVKYGATWCGPCKLIAPILEQVAEEHPEVNVIEVDIDDEKAARSVENFQITSVPTVFFYKKGQVVEKFLGFRPKEEIEKILNKI